MPILYAVIARDPSTVLAKFAACTGNFSEVTEQILGKITNENSKLTYSHGAYLFHYVKEDLVTYLCITDDDFERSRAFMFLAEIKNRFKQTYGMRAIQDALPYGMNSDFSPLLASEMKRFTEARDLDAISKVQGHLDELKDIVVKNIDDIAARGERLELLVNKAENLNTTSISFRTASRNVARAMWWKNIKFGIIVGLVAILVIYLIVSFSCGGLLWSSCVGPSNKTG